MAFFRASFVSGRSDSGSKWMVPPKPLRASSSTTTTGRDGSASRSDLAIPRIDVKMVTVCLAILLHVLLSFDGRGKVRVVVIWGV